MTEEQIPLSPAGELRREEILVLAKHQARQRRACRIAQHASVYIFLAASATLLLRHSSTPKASVFSPSPPPSHPSDPAPASNALVFYIPTDSGIAQRLSTPPQPAAWKSIDDDQLLHLLTQTGHPAGLIHISGQTILLPR